MTSDRRQKRVVCHKHHATKHNSHDTVSKELYKIHSKDAGMSYGWTESQRYRRKTQYRLLNVNEISTVLDTKTYSLPLIRSLLLQTIFVLNQSPLLQSQRYR